MAIAGSCVSTMAKPCVQITTSPESATRLYTPNTRKRQAGRLANLSSHCSGQCCILFSHGQCYLGTWAEQSHMSSPVLAPCGLAIGNCLGSDAGVIPGVDTSVLFPHIVKHESFPIRSWVGLRHLCDSSPYIPFHFRDCRNYFCLLRK